MYSPLLNTLNEYISLNEAEIEVIKDYFRVKRFKKANGLLGKERQPIR